MTATTPPVERVEVEQVDSTFYADLHEADVYTGKQAALEFIARYRIATAQAFAAEIARLEKERDEALRECTRWAREAGEAKGILDASEMAGAVDGWKRRALADEAASARLREALEPFAKMANELERVAEQHAMHPSKIGRSHSYYDCVRARSALAGGSTQEVVDRG